MDERIALHAAARRYEMDRVLLRPWGGMGEQYWTSEKMDWLLYHSHENSLTVGGEWLLNGVKKAWPEWERYLYAANPHSSL